MEDGQRERTKLLPHLTSNTWFHCGNPILCSSASCNSSSEMGDHKSLVLSSRPYTCSRTAIRRSNSSERCERSVLMSSLTATGPDPRRVYFTGVRPVGAIHLLTMSRLRTPPPPHRDPGLFAQAGISFARSIRDPGEGDWLAASCENWDAGGFAIGDYRVRPLH